MSSKDESGKNMKIDSNDAIKLIYDELKGFKTVSKMLIHHNYNEIWYNSIHEEQETKNTYSLDYYVGINEKEGKLSIDEVDFVELERVYQRNVSMLLYLTEEDLE